VILKGIAKRLNGNLKRHNRLVPTFIHSFIHSRLYSVPPPPLAYYKIKLKRSTPSELGCELCMSVSHTTREWSPYRADDGSSRASPKQFTTETCAQFQRSWPTVHGTEKTRKRTFLPVYKESLLDTGASGVSDAGGVATDRDRCLEVCWSHFPYWGSDNSSKGGQPDSWIKILGRWEVYIRCTLGLQNRYCAWW